MEDSEIKEEKDLELAKYMDELHNAYWLPHSCKWVAWLLSISTILVSCVVLLLYGMTFGPVKSKLWLTSVFTSEGINMVVTQPLKALILAFISCYVLKLEYRLHHRPLTPDILINTPAADHLNPRHVNPQYYLPPDQDQRNKRKKEIEAEAAVAEARKQLTTYVVVMLVLYVLIANDSSAPDALTAATHNSVKSFIFSTPLDTVTSYKRFIMYLNESLLPSLMTDSTEMMKTGTALLGSPRLRQRRVLSGNCDIEWKVSGYGWLPSCPAELTWYNEDTHSYDIAWTRYTHSPRHYDDLSASHAHTNIESDPWIYRSSKENGGAWGYVGRLTKFTWGSGGYVVQLGKTLANSRQIIHSLQYFGWIDARTRHIYVDFTLYSVNTNLFHVVTIMFEFSAAGVVIPSHKMRTEVLLYGDVWRLTMHVVAVLMLLVAVCWLMWHTALRIYKLSFTKYFNSDWGKFQMSLVLCGAFALLSIVARAHTISKVMSQMDVADSNEYLNFENVALFARLSNAFIATTLFGWTVTALEVAGLWTVRFKWAWPVFVTLFVTAIFTLTIPLMLLHLLYGNTEESLAGLYSGVAHGFADELGVSAVHPYDTAITVIFRTVFVAFGLASAHLLLKIPTQQKRTLVKTLLGRKSAECVLHDTDLHPYRLKGIKALSANLLAFSNNSADYLGAAKTREMERTLHSVLGKLMRDQP